MILKKVIKLNLLGSLFFSHMLMANSWDVNVHMGSAHSKLSNSPTVTPVYGLTKSYTVDRRLQSTFFIGVGAEYVFDHLTKKTFELGLGVSAFYINLGDISGTEIPGTNIGLTDPLNYTMKANSKVIMFKPRLIYTANPVKPYVFVGLGYAQNTLNSFSESAPAGSFSLPSSLYANNTNNNLAYELGIGVQYAFLITKKNKLSFNVEYRYLNLGNAKLGTSAGQTTSDSLAINSISTNIFNIGLSYQF